MLRIKSEVDFWSGVMFALCGVLAVVMSRGYPRGTAVAMGPGYFPTVIGMVLVAVGLIIAATSFKIEGEKINRSFNLKAILSVSAGLVLFGWGIERLGFIPSLIALVFLGALAGRQFNWLEFLLLGALIVPGSWLVFIVALDLPIPLFWWG